jgi:hypothetical protein
MFVGDICEENKASIEDDSPYSIYVGITFNQLCNIYL